jgi:predicted transcriptional regulator
MPDLPAISNAESLVMDVLWNRSPQTTDEIVAELTKRTDWQEATIKTFLNRLLKKGAVRAEQNGRRYQYFAVLQRADWIASESRTVLDRLFGGRVAPLVAHFSERQELSKEDLAELRKLIDRLDP